MLALIALIVFPVGLVGLALASMGLGWGVFAVTMAATSTFVASVFAHEFAHAAVHTALARRSDGCSDLLGVGTWGRATILRFTLGSDRDALVSLAGPAAGLATGIPLLVPSATFLVTGFLPLLFLVHGLSLLPWASDGRQLRTHLNRRARPGALAEAKGGRHPC